MHLGSSCKAALSFLVLISVGFSFLGTKARAQSSEASSSTRASAETKSETRIEKGDGDAAVVRPDLNRAEGEQTASFKDQWPAPLNKMEAGYWSRSDVGKDSVHNSDPQAATINRFSLSYKPDDRHIWVANQEIDITYGHIGGFSSANMNDLYLGYVDTKAGTVFDWNLTAALRVYLPTGEQSHYVTRRAGAIAGLFIQDRTVGRIDFSNVVFGIHHNQTQDSYLALNSNTLTSNDDTEVDDYFETAYNVSDSFSTYYTLGLEQVWERPLPTVGIQQLRHLFSEVGARYKLTKTVTLAASIWNDASLINPAGRDQFQIFRDDESGFRLYFSASM